MKAFVKKFIMLAVICLGFAAPSYAQSEADNTPQSNLKFTNLTTDDGLSQAHVYEILQDRKMIGKVIFSVK